MTLDEVFPKPLSLYAVQRMKQTKPELRCSSLPQFMTCSNSGLNPDKLPSVESDNEAAEAGTAVHALAEEYARTGSFDLTKLKGRLGAEDYDRAGKLVRNFVRVFDVARKQMPKPEVEVYLEADVGPVLLTGHIDLMQKGARSAYILDYKTGRQHENYYHQMAGYAYITWSSVGRVVPYVVHASIVFLEDNTVVPYSFTDADLIAWEAKLKEQIDTPKYTAGRKCAGCKLNGGCKAYHAWAGGAVAVFNEDFTVGSDAWKTLTPDERGELMDRVYVVEKAIDRIKSSLRNAVRSKGALDVGSGTEYTLVTDNIEFLDPVRARATLTKHKTLPLPVLDKLSRISLDETLSAVQSRAAKGVKMEARKKVYELLDEAGAIVRSSTTKMWRRPKGEKKLES